MKGMSKSSNEMEYCEYRLFRLYPMVIAKCTFILSKHAKIVINLTSPLAHFQHKLH
jgi:hypothetical protein